jgi:hypothetical protein
MRGDDHPSWWWYAVGVMTLHKGAFPGPVTDSKTNNHKYVNQSVLYVLKDCKCKPTTTTTTTTTTVNTITTKWKPKSQVVTTSTSGTLDKTPVGMISILKLVTTTRGNHVCANATAR